METSTLHRKISVFGVFCVLFQILSPIFIGPPVFAMPDPFPFSYQLTDNSSNDTNIDATSHNGESYVTYDRDGTVYMKKGIGQEEVVGSGSNPAIAVGNGGIVHIVYENGGIIIYAKKIVQWTTETISAGSNADIDVDSGNSAHIVYQTPDIDYNNKSDIVYTNNTGGSFDAGTTIWDGYWWYDSGAGTGRYYWSPHIKIDAAGNYHIISVHHAYDKGMGWQDHYYYILYTSNKSGGINYDSTSAGNWSPTLSKNSLILDETGMPHIIYNWPDGNYYHSTINTSWNATSLGSGINTPSITTGNGIIAVAYNDGLNNLYYIQDSGSGFGSAVPITTGTSPIISYNGSEKFFYSLQNDGNDDEVWIKSANAIYTVPGQIDTTTDSFVSTQGGSVQLSGLEVGGVYTLMDGSIVASVGALVATGTTGSLTLNPSLYLSYSKHTLTLSGSYNSITTPDIASKDFYIGPFDYQDLYVNQLAPTLLTNGIVNNLGDVTYANVQNFSGLYFEKTGLGRITFSASLDLTNSGTITFLQNLPNKLDMSDGVIGFDPTDSDFANYGASLSMYFDTGSTFVTSINDPENFVIKTQTGQILDSSGILSNIHGACGVGEPYCTLVFDTAHFTSFDLKPILTDVHIVSDNAYSGSMAKPGDHAVLSFSGSESLTGVTVTFNGAPAQNVIGGGNSWTATSQSLDTSSPVTFTINYRDLTGNTGTPVTTTTDGSSVNIDATPPSAGVEYSITSLTAQDVVATLTGATEDIVVTNNAGNTTHTFTGNGVFIFQFRDAVGNTGNVTATVTNINKSIPTVTLNGSGSIDIEQSGSYTELGATWSDQTDGTGAVSVISGSVDTHTLGVYPIEYQYTNSLGVVGSTTRTVNIVDTIPPIAPTLTTPSGTTSGSTLSNLTGSGEAGTSISLSKNGSSVCGSNTVDEFGSFVIVNFGNCLSLVEGSNTFTATARDPSGNSSGTGNTITITRDSTAPIIGYTEIRDITVNQAVLEFSFTENHFTHQTAEVKIYQGASLYATFGIDAYSGSIGNTTIGGLNPDSTYTYVLSLTDDVGNTESTTGSFTTSNSQSFGEVPSTLYETGGLLFGNVDGYIGSGNTFSLNGNNVYIYSDPSDSDSASGSLVLSGVDIEVVSGNWNGILLPPHMLESANPNSATSAEIGSGRTVGNTFQAGSEGSSLAASGGYFTVSFQIPGSSSGTTFLLYRSEDGNSWVPVTPDSSCTLDAGLMCTFRTDHLSFFVPVYDDVPDAFSFTAVTNAELNTISVSNTITISGINTGSSISITGGEYKIGAGSYTTTTGIVYSGDTVTIRLTSSNNYSTAKSATLNIGGISATYTVTTKAASSGGSSGGGGGGVAIDTCPQGDTSGSFYDGKCSRNTPTGSGVSQTSNLNSPFKDIENSFAREYIKSLFASGIVSGYQDNSLFRPNATITRGDWVVWVMKAYKIPLDSATGSVFQDIPRNSQWMIPYLNTAKKLGIISGQKIGKKLVFRPNSSITRAEALKILFLTAKMDTTSTSKLMYRDSDIQKWMIPYIIRATELRIIDGQWMLGKRYFTPNRSLSRAEAAKILYNFIHY